MYKTTLNGEVASYCTILRKKFKINEMIDEFVNDINNDADLVSYICRKIMFDDILISRNYPEYLEYFSNFCRYSSVILDDNDLKKLEEIDKFLKSRYIFSKYYKGTSYKGVISMIVLYLFLKYFRKDLYEEYKQFYITKLKPLNQYLNISK